MIWKRLAFAALNLAGASGVIVAFQIIFGQHHHRGYWAVAMACGVIVCSIGNHMTMKEIKTFIRAVGSKIVPLDPKHKINVHAIHFVMLGHEGPGPQLVISTRAGGFAKDKGLFLMTEEKKPESNGTTFKNVVTKPLSGAELRRQLRAMAAVGKDCVVRYSDNPYVGQPTFPGKIDLSTVGL
ncbi:MAG TPA: hypothetical protein VIJ29_04590 [Candidatus Paceibacterota bacterium]